MNNDNNDDRDDDSTSSVPHTDSADSSLRREPGFSVFDSDTELEVDDIEPEDFANDYATQGYDDEPFGDSTDLDEDDPSTQDEDSWAEDPVASLWEDNDETELDEPLSTVSARTPWDDDNEVIDNNSEPDAVEMGAEKGVEQEIESDGSSVQDAFIAGAAASAAAAKKRDLVQRDEESSAAEADLDDISLADDGEDKDEYDDEGPWDHDAVDDESDDDYEENDYVEERAKLPVGLIIVALVALALLAAGGYGVIKERAATEAELTELRARLATAVEQEDIESERQRARSLETENTRLQAQLDSVSGDNDALASQLASLQQQLERLQQQQQQQQQQQLQEANAQQASKPAPKPAPVPASSRTDTTAQKSSVAATRSGSWFVNFGSYTQRAMAEEWASRLKPGAGRVTVAAASRSSGTIYRVRVIDLDTKEGAQRIAAELERVHDVSKLWVGQE